jgi:SAM-dependent methyltransferase
MTSQPVTHESELHLFEELSVEKMPAHWLMARLGKRVLRPGGVETTQWLLENAHITADDDVVEFAPGLAVTARDILRRGPKSYVGIEREASAQAFSERALERAGCSEATVVEGDASHVPLPDGKATLVVGEAMLSMQSHDKKLAIMREAFRLLKPGGRYAIHELAVTPNDIDRTRLALIHGDLSKHIHVGVRIGTVAEWTQWVEDCGFVVEKAKIAPMRLLEPGRMLRDEGLLGVSRFLFNVVRTPGARKRLTSVRGIFRKYRSDLCAIALVARRPA